MKKKWLIATYKNKEVARVECNLQYQNFYYYLPKLTIKEINSNSNPKEVALFPGYIFIYTSLENYSALKYTIGIKNIIKFGDNISCISDEDIKSMQMAEKNSKVDPITTQVQVGQNVSISEGSLRGSMVKICSLPSKGRVDVLLTFLGSIRRITLPIKDLTF